MESLGFGIREPSASGAGPHTALQPAEPRRAGGRRSPLPARHPETLVVGDSHQALCPPQVIWMSAWQPQTWRTSCTARRRTSCSSSGSTPARSRGCTPRSGGCSNTAQVRGPQWAPGTRAGDSPRPARAVEQSRTCRRAHLTLAGAKAVPGEWEGGLILLSSLSLVNPIIPGVHLNALPHPLCQGHTHRE